MIICRSIGTAGQLIANHMPMPNVHDLTCGITYHNKTNPLKNTMQIYSTKVKLHFHKIGQQTSGILYHVMPLFLTFTIMTSCRSVFVKKPTEIVQRKLPKQMNQAKLPFSILLEVTKDLLKSTS